jgi:methylated-DNA-[protein]-cysteine S-methyltransferase
MSVDTCLVTDDQILAYVAGEAPEETATEMAQHLADCRSCCDRAVEFRILEDCLGQVTAAEAVRWTWFDSPFGAMYLAATDEGLAWVSWRQPDEDTLVGVLEERFPGRPVLHDPDGLTGWRDQLAEYFSGKRTAFDLPVDLRSMSDFERAVLETAREIPYGEVLPYAEVARRIKKPRASRAVGNALGHNPVAIVVPCHRVVRSDGTLGGYTGGVEYKRKLLAIEGRLDLLLAG